MKKYGAGVLPIAQSTGRALVLLRSSSVSEPLTWAPAGGSEESFDAEQPLWTAVREFIEETGYRPSEEIFPIATGRGERADFYLFASIEPEEFTPTLDWENVTYGWFTFEELLELKGKHPGFEDMLAHSLVQTDLRLIMVGR